MNRLKKLREEKKLLQSDIAKIIKTTPQAVGLYENEKRDMSPKVILQLSEYFNVTSDYLLGKTDIKNTLIKIPVLGTVKAGYDWLAEENVIGYIADKDTVKDYEKNINEYYALRITRSVNVTTS